MLSLCHLAIDDDACALPSHCARFLFTPTGCIVAHARARALSLAPTQEWDHFPAQFERLGRLGVRTRQSLLAGLWVQAVTGHNWFGSLNKVGDWPGDAGNWTRWEHFVEETVAASPSGLSFDVWNEPGFAPGYFWDRSHSQYLEMWSRAARVARQVRPGAKLVGPSTSSFDVGFITDFLVRKIGTAGTISQRSKSTYQRCLP